MTALALIAVNVLIYAPVRHYNFVEFDDPSYVRENMNVSGGLTWHAVWWGLASGHTGNWHPLTWWSHMLDVQLYGMNPGPHHLTNLLLHIANTLLLFGLLFRLTGTLGRSAFVAGLFAVHPLHVESVAWIAERKDLLSTLFWMLALWAYAAYVRQPRRSRYLAVLLLFALGLMAKPMVVTLPFVLLLLDVWPLRRVVLDASASRRPAEAATWRRWPTWRPLVYEKLPLFFLSATSSLVTFFVQKHGGAVSGLNQTPLGLRLQNALVSYVAYIGKMIWPAHLALLYPFPQSIPGWRLLGSILVLVCISVVAMRAARRHPYLPVGWLWYLGTLVPVIGLVQVGVQSIADRYTYVPLIGIFIVVAWGVPDLLQHWRYQRSTILAAAALVITACTLTARIQVRYWKDNLVLWTHATELNFNVDAYQAHIILGTILRDQADPGRISEAISHFSEAVRLRPDSAEAHCNLGLSLASRGRIDEAIHEFNAALAINPKNEEVRGTLEDLMKRGKRSGR